jgi:hypothetical protein
MADVILESVVTCPKCRHQAAERMPTDACQFFYDCKGCGERLKPLPGDCCVFCSFGTVKCPPMQAAHMRLLNESRLRPTAPRPACRC